MYGKFAERFHFPILWHLPLCLTRVHWVLFVNCANATDIQERFSVTLISGGMFYIQECPLKRIVHSWTFFLLFSFAHFQIVSTVTVKLLNHFGFVC